MGHHHTAFSATRQGSSPAGLGAQLGRRAPARGRVPCRTKTAGACDFFGGLGYIRETGIERIVRDVNHLRLLAGTPDELLLFLSQ